MQKLNDLSRSLAPLEPDGTLIAVIEMSQSSWLVAGIVPGVERQPLKKLAADEIALLKLLHRWREEAEKAGHRIERTAVAFEAGRDGFWLARWLRTRSIEAHVIHVSSVAVSREHRRAKTDRLDTELLKRAFLGWLRGERDHCKMVAIPSCRRRLCRECCGHATTCDDHGRRMANQIGSQRRQSIVRICPTSWGMSGRHRFMRYFANRQRIDGETGDPPQGTPPQIQKVPFRRICPTSSPAFPVKDARPLRIAGRASMLVRF
jgi:hypothetical protein